MVFAVELVLTFRLYDSAWKRGFLTVFETFHRHNYIGRRIFRVPGDNEKTEAKLPSGQIRQVFVSPGGICGSPMKVQDG